MQVEKENSNWVNFELGEDVRDETRLRQDQEWSGAITDGRVHVSHRELAMLNAPQLCLSISDYNLIEELVVALHSNFSILGRITPETLRNIVEFAFPGHGPLVTSSVIRRNLTITVDAERKYSNTEVNNEFPFRICLRKRPMLEFEHSFGAYDVCHADTRNGITLHEGRLARNGRQLSMTHHQFVVDRVFDEDADNALVCKDSIEPLLSWAEAGHSSTLLCFGQTGTGKTYTMYGALEYISSRLLGKSIRITFYEVHGSKCYDLLSNRNVVYLRSDENENMHLRGARNIVVSPLTHTAQLIGVLREALKLRSSKVTERNPISSRSHAVCTIEITSGKVVDSAIGTSTQNGNLPSDRSLGGYLTRKATEVATQELTAMGGIPISQQTSTVYEGKITLVDLAGSERNYETTKMTAAQHKESADINFALMALKDCFRAYHMQLNQVYGRGVANPLQQFKTNNNTNRVNGNNRSDDDDCNIVVPNLFNSTSNTRGAIRLIHNTHLDMSSLRPQAVHCNARTCSSSSSSSLIAESSCLSDNNLPPISLVDPGTDNTAASNGNTAVGCNTPSVLVRIPFRSSMLTKVLKECFTSGANHRTTIIATVSPTPTDLAHSLNTINHVVLMCPELLRLIHRVTVDVPLTSHLLAAATIAEGDTLPVVGFSNKLVSDWSCDDVTAWLATAERGRFADVILPKGITGSELLQLSATHMSDLFTQSKQHTARGHKEGAAWVEAARKVSGTRALGKELWSALRREMQSTLARISTATTI